MIERKQMLKSLAALGLMLTLLVPTFVQFAHVFGVHEHFVCTETDSHLHQTPVKCDICTVQMTAFDYGLETFGVSDLLELQVELTQQTVTIQAGALIFNSNPHRGPPSYS